MPDFPVFTRKPATDLCYLACAKRLLAARPRLYPQFATHNALTVAIDHRDGRRQGFRVPAPARHGRGALRGRCTGARASTAASTRRSAATRSCSPIWCAGCSRTAPTPPSSMPSTILTVPIESLLDAARRELCRRRVAAACRNRAAGGDSSASARTRAAWSSAAAPISSADAQASRRSRFRSRTRIR